MSDRARTLVALPAAGPGVSAGAYVSGLQYRATVRGLVDLDAVTAELTDATRRTVQPAAAGLWLRGAAR